VVVSTGVFPSLASTSTVRCPYWVGSLSLWTNKQNSFLDEGTSIFIIDYKTMNATFFCGEKSRLRSTVEFTDDNFRSTCNKL
jgi:hypothetical protein